MAPEFVGSRGFDRSVDEMAGANKPSISRHMASLLSFMAQSIRAYCPLGE